MCHAGTDGSDGRVQLLCGSIKDMHAYKPIRLMFWHPGLESKFTLVYGAQIKIFPY